MSSNLVTLTCELTRPGSLHEECPLVGEGIHSYVMPVIYPFDSNAVDEEVIFEFRYGPLGE